MVYKSETGDNRLLIVAPEDEVRIFFGRLLDRNGLVVNRIETGQQCLEASAQAAFNLILIRIPLPDLSVSALATGLTQRFSLNSDTPLVMLAQGKQYEAALGYSSPRIQVVDVTDPSTNIERLVTAALGVALRTTARLDVELEVEAETASTRRRCRTHDISRSGMLLESEQIMPIGSEFVFNFTLPERFTPIHGRAQVVRHSGEKSAMSAMGVKFVDFPEGAEDAIEAFVVQNRLTAR